ncbi:MAG: cytochrome C, partial [Desulfobacteraceae bacterium]|nr:cytochrome C [Desulfobacteraceae bacterium]MBC2752615.1 NapC/NirT family cytochrome c [Desulfobacteraceae bacterium]
MKKYIIGGSLVFLGVLLSFPLFSMSYYTMVRTSTPEFCASCHEIKPAVVAWRSSTHTNNAAGVVVDCMDCHLPAPQNTFDFFFAKTYHGIKDVVKHFTMEAYDREKNREAAYAAFDNAECQKCHR